MNALSQLNTALSGRYEVEREIGAGGMATVYLARDLKHDRRVALKVLKPELGAVLGVERFLSEIKVTANLQHPNLLPLFDSGEANGLLFYVMPYVEGESLRARLDREKQLPVDEAIRIATGIAAALDYAHRNGVIHRDLKPENILLQDGQPVIADFGIALAVSNAGGNRITQTGLSLGTPQYMSPEQATGDRTIDGRTDIYSLGAVTYEMLVGDPPYLGGTTQAVIAKLLTEKPRGVRVSRANVPVYVEAAIEHSLEKLPADRFATAHEFSEALHGRGAVATTAGTGAWSAGGAAPRSPGGRASRVAGIVFALAVAAVSGALLWKWLGPKAEAPIRPMVRFGIQLPRDAEPVGATGSTIAFSPDGGRIVYVGRSKSGIQLYSRGLDQLNPAAIPGSEGGSLPFFSANGQWVGFKQGARIVKVALAGGPVTPVCDAPGETYGATWSAGDTIIFASDSGLMEVPVAGGVARVLARPDSGEAFRWPEILPDDRALLFAVRSPKSLRLAALVRRTGKIRRLQQVGSYPQYVESGFVVFSDPSGIVSAAPFDVKRLDVTGAALPIADKLLVGSDGDRNMGVSRSGAIAYQASPFAAQRLVLVDRSGTARDVGADSGFYGFPRFSPDGKRVALTRFTDITGAASDLWVIDLAQHTRTRLTFDTTSAIPLWTPDGKRIAYSRFPEGFFGRTGRILWVPADGSGAPDSLAVTPGSWVAGSFLPLGRGLLYAGQSSPQGKGEIWQLALGGGSTPQKVLANGFSNCCPSLSPDGRWFAYQSNESGRPEVYVRPFPGPGGRWQVSLDGGVFPLWSFTGGEIFYASGDRMMAASVRTQGAFEVGSRTQLFVSTQVDLGRGYDVTRDGRTFVMLKAGQQGADQTVVVMLNWFDQLRARRK